MRASHYFLAIILIIFLFSSLSGESPRPRLREFGIKTGILPPGPLNTITDVPGVKVGHVTIIKGDNIRTGVTAICPHDGNIYQEKVPAAIYVANGYGKLTGISQVDELGNIETPIILTNTLSVPVAAEALIEYTLSLPGNENVSSVNPIVGETNDGWLNDIRGRHVTKEHVIEAIKKAHPGPVEEGAVGAGTGTICFGFKGGIGTASRKLPESLGGYTVGVLVQTNHGGILQIKGVPVGVYLGKFFLKSTLTRESPGSCMVVVATDAPLSSRNLKRLAKRALLGIARTGGFYSNGSGDYAIAFSTAPELRIPHRTKSPFLHKKVLRNSQMSPLFLAAVEACEEAILNSLFKACSMTGRDGHKVEALPLDKIKKFFFQEEKK
ncbi:P1 family peptidase [Candidatus Aminicenantes bacterium AC-334-K16]|nr:P1 family peptidase [Candidatus Aminicenantes bacterium AC-334-K16]